MFIIFICRRLSWFDGSGMGFSLEYPTIGLHAISRDVGAYPQEHLYVMVNGKLSGEGNSKYKICIQQSIGSAFTADLGGWMKSKLAFSRFLAVGKQGKCLFCAKNLTPTTERAEPHFIIWCRERLYVNRQKLQS